MKVDFSVYNQIGINDNKQNHIHPPKSRPATTDSIPPQKVEKKFISEKVGRGADNAMQDKVSLDSSKIIPSKLSDVLTNQEQEMLSKLFPAQGSGWGVSAYQSASLAYDVESGKGNRLDMMT